jgi:predicted RND superfamily exporter protein
MGMFIHRANPYEYYNLEVMDETTNKVNLIENTQGMSMVTIMDAVAMPDELVVGGLNIETRGMSFWDVVQMLYGLGLERAGQEFIDLWYDVLSYEPREMLISTGTERALIYTFMPFLDIDATRAAVDGVNAVVAEQSELYNDKDLFSDLTGIAAITLAVNDLIIASQFNSLAVCIALTFIVLTIIFKSLKIGFLTIIPVLCVIALEPGTLVALDIPLSTITVMIGSIAIGTGVDFSIQISQRVRLGGYKLGAVFNAVEKAGTSFVEATSTMLLGFGMCLFIQIDSIQEFVIMIMILLAYNAIFALVLLPSLFTLYIRRQDAREARMRAAPMKAKSKARSRYERAVKAIFRIREEPAEAGGYQQMALPLETIEEKPKE